MNFPYSGRSSFFPESFRAFFLMRTYEAIGLAFVFFSVFSFLSLSTYDHLDPSLNTIVFEQTSQNFWGMPGSYFADLIWQTFGMSGYMIPAVSLIWGLIFITHNRVWYVGLKVLTLLGAMILMSCAFAYIPWLKSFGGFLGKIICYPIMSLLKTLHVKPLGYLLSIPLGLVSIVLFILASGLNLATWKQIFKRLTATVLKLKAMCDGLYNKGAAVSRDEDADVVKGSARIQEPTFDLGYVAESEDSEDSDFDAIIDMQQEVSAAPRPKSPSKPARQSLLAQAHLESYQLPELDCLNPIPSGEGATVSKAYIEQNIERLSQVLSDFGVRGKVIKARPGPVVTLYEFEPAPGIKSSRIIGLADDIARSMSALSARIAAIPGQTTLGIELPNDKRQSVYIRELFENGDFDHEGSKLTIALGKNIGGTPVFADLARMPHVIVAGTTGSGKSVAVNGMILSLLYRHSPQTCRLILIDPKMLELSVYNGIPHLLTPVVTDPGKAVYALKWTVREMENRYRAMSHLSVRNIEGYNQAILKAKAQGQELSRKVQTGFDPETGQPMFEEQPIDMKPLPYIVVVVDEMADLMMVAGKDIESAVQRLAQMARAAGIHVVMATQRPSVDVITGTIKANFPTRISFQVASKFDSKTILGEQGAEQLLGRGDMLFMESGGKIQRLHGPFVGDDEVERVVSFLKRQGTPDYVDTITEEADDYGLGSLGAGEEKDEMYRQAIDIVRTEGKASTSFIQRRLQIGYNRAARLMEQMEADGVVSSPNHVGKREILSR